jgi:hypothetical protein
MGHFWLFWSILGHRSTTKSGPTDTIRSLGGRPTGYTGYTTVIEETVETEQKIRMFLAVWATWKHRDTSKFDQKSAVRSTAGQDL